MTWALADYGRVIVTYVLTVIVGGFIIYLINTKGKEAERYDPMGGFEFIAEKEGEAMSFSYAPTDYASSGYGHPSKYTDF